jgi:two-component system sensor histidine kinase EvgS
VWLTGVLLLVQGSASLAAVSLPFKLVPATQERL